MLKYITLFLMTVCLTSTAFAGKDASAEKQRLQDVKKTIQTKEHKKEKLEKKAQKTEKDIYKIKKKMAGLAQDVQKYEDLLTKIDETLDPLTEKLNVQKKELEARRKKMALLLAALQRLSMQPQEMIIVSKEPLERNVRTATLLITTTSQIQKNAETIRKKVEQISFLHSKIETKQNRQRKIFKKMLAERKNLKKLSLQKSRIYKSSLAEVKQISGQLQKLANKAEDLRDLVDKLKEDKKKRRPKKKSYGKVRKGKLRLPASGKIISKFGGTDSYGHHRKGIEMKVRKGAKVTAPFAGEVLFAGTFRRYGKMLIIDHGRGFVTLLAGLKRIDRDIGETLVLGEPIGIMGNGSNETTLYIELRRDGDSVNPLPWFSKKR
ncbi:MAG: murein hydrolase activator EnvC family protein [Alphaproteobacteria bacterium]